MHKVDLLNAIKLLSALESWGFSNGSTLPKFLHARIHESIQVLSFELLAPPKEKRSGNQVPQRPALSETGQCGHPDGEQVV